jgi:hypothetical protein
MVVSEGGGRDIKVFLGPDVIAVVSGDVVGGTGIDGVPKVAVRLVEGAVVVPSGGKAVSALSDGGVTVELGGLVKGGAEVVPLA